MSAICEAYAERLRELLPLDFPPTLGIYVVGRYEVAGAFENVVGCSAYTGDCLDLQLRPWLTAEGRWRGRGFAVLIQQVALLFSDPADVLDVLLHEAAHRWQRFRPDSILQNTLPERWPPQADFLKCLTEPPAVLSDDERESRIREHSTEKPYAMHEAEFIRSALHLEHRANLSGFETTAERMNVAGECYGLSPAAAYRERLGDECRRMESTPLVDVMQTPAPQAFLDLFNSDTRPARVTTGDIPGTVGFHCPTVPRPDFER